MHIGILCAMPQEIGKLLENLKILNERNFGDLKIISGQFSDENKEEDILVSLAWSGWGKVSAARAATRLLSNPYSGKTLDLILFTGVAGAAASSVAARGADVAGAARTSRATSATRAFVAAGAAAIAGAAGAA